MLKLKLQYFGHLMRRAESLEKTLMLENTEAGGEGGNRGWDGWMASPTEWTWVCVDFRSWWWTGRPVVLEFMGSQGVRHDWVTNLIWSDPREAWRAAIHGVAKSLTWLSDWTELNWTEWSSGFLHFLQFKSEFGNKDFRLFPMFYSMIICSQN